MDLKEPGNQLYLVGKTRKRIGRLALRPGRTAYRAGAVPQVDAADRQEAFAAIHRAILAGLIRTCHDLSEGGLAVAAAEMAFAGNLGARSSSIASPTSLDVDADGSPDGRRRKRFRCCYSPNRTRVFYARCGRNTPRRLPRPWPTCRTPWLATSRIPESWKFVSPSKARAMVPAGWSSGSSRPSRRHGRNRCGGRSWGLGS